MPAVQRFPRRDHRGRLRPALLLTPERLSIYQGRKPRHLLWSEVLNVRWLDRERAELALVSGETVELERLDQLAEAVAAIDQRIGHVRSAGGNVEELPRDLVLGLLPPPPVSSWRLLVGTVASGAAGFLIAIMPPTHRHLLEMGPWLWWITAGSAAVGAVLVWYSPSMWPIRVNVVGVDVHGTNVPWKDVVRVAGARAVQRLMGFYVLEVSLETTAGVVTTRDLLKDDVEAIERVLVARSRWRGNAYVPAGALPPPDNALSLARETGQEATDRGLSLTVSVKGDS